MLIVDALIFLVECTFYAWNLESKCERKANIIRFDGDCMNEFQSGCQITQLHNSIQRPWT